MKAKIEALLNQIQSGNIKTLHAKILNYAQKKKGFFIREIEEVFKVARSTATARVSELEDMGLIKNMGGYQTRYAKDKQGYYRYLVTEEEQKKHRWLRRSQKYNRWLNSGIEEGWLDESLNVIR